MTSAKLLLLEYILIIRSRLLLCAAFVIICLYSAASGATTSCIGDCRPLLDGKCSQINSKGNKNPAVITDCVFGMCAICDNKDYFNPKAEVLYMPGAYKGFTMVRELPVYSRSIGIHECSWLLGVRFCVRPTQSGDIDAPPAPSGGSPRATNTSGHPKICAYEDPCDGMDPPDGNCASHSNLGPFAYMTSNADAISLANAAVIGSIAGGAVALICPPCLVVSVVTAVAVAAIESHFNHVVTTPVGCIDRAMGPMPPTWKNNAWWNNSAPIPTFSDAGVKTYNDETTTNSVFEAPVVDMRVCKDSNTSQIVDCSLSNAVTDNDAETSAKIHLSSTPTAGCSGNDTSLSPYCACKTVNYSLLTTSITYCASVTTDKPDVITISARHGASPSYSYDYVASIPRPGYIPKPAIAIVDAALGTSNIGASIGVTLRGATITLSELLYTYSKTTDGVTTRYTCNTQAHIIDSGTTYNGYCTDASNKISALPENLTSSPPLDWEVLPQSHPKSNFLHQVQFSIERPCADGKLDVQTLPDVNGNSFRAYACSEYKNMVCIQGYDTAPFVAVNPSTPAPYASYGSAPNVKNNNIANTATIGTAFPNIHSNQENGVYLNEAYTASTDAAHSFDGNVWVYPYTATSGTPASPATSSYVYNNAQHGDTLRILNSNEAGMCIKTAPDQRLFTYVSPGDYTLTVPINCSKMKVAMWGGGASGGWGDNTPHANHNGVDTTGGAGGYITGEIPASAGATIAITVGAGGRVNNGNNSSGAGTASSISATFSGITYTAIARGGTAASYNGQGSYTYSFGGDTSFSNLQNVYSHNGGNGAQGYVTDAGAAGGSVYDQSDNVLSPGQAASECSSRNVNGTQATSAPSGGGGCSRSDSTYYYEYCDTPGCLINNRGYTKSNLNGSWGKGGNGYVQIQCIQ